MVEITLNVAHSHIENRMLIQVQVAKKLLVI